MCKVKNTVISLLLLCLAVMTVTGCGTESSGGQSADGRTEIFVDSAGRSVEIPEQVETIAPSGAYAQMYLTSLCPDKLLGLSSSLTRRQKEYLPEGLQELPVFGQFYGKNTTMNFEEIIKASPDVIIDVGEAKKDIAKDMDSIQEQTGIPVVFIESALETTPETFAKLGVVTDEEERASELAAYCQQVIDLAGSNRERLAEEDVKTVYYGDGEYGTQSAAAGSTHAEVFDMIGADNVTKLDNYSESGADEVPMEEIINWDPEIVFLTEDANYDEIYDDPAWASVTAVKEHRVFEVPSSPYNWMDRPPSVQRILGILWAGNLVYPELYDYDMVKKTQEYYQLFYGCQLSKKDAEALLENSTLSVQS